MDIFASRYANGDLLISQMNFSIAKILNELLRTYVSIACDYNEHEIDVSIYQITAI